MQQNERNWHIETVSWSTAAGALMAVRRAVFIEEQGIPEELEWEPADHECMHALAMDAQGTAIGAGRLLRNGTIGRMAVLKNWRGMGVGKALLEHLIKKALEQGHTELRLNAQTRVKGFYASHGFKPEGEVFYEAGIAHQLMIFRLRPS